MPTSTPTPTPVVIQAPVEPPEPAEPAARDLFIATNADGGELLLPYIEASGSQSDYSIILAVDADFDTPELIDTIEFEISGQASTEAKSADVVRLDFGDLANFLGEEDPGLFVGFQMVGNQDVSYGRGGDFDKWIDITSIFGTPERSGILPVEQTDGSGDSSLAELLFEQATGDFNPAHAAAIEDETGKSPFLDFQQVASPPGTLVFVHETFDRVEELVGTTEERFKIEFVIDAETGLVTRATRTQQFEAVGLINASTLLVQRYEMSYEPQVINIPQAGAPSVETDPARIAAFQALFE